MFPLLTQETETVLTKVHTVNTMLLVNCTTLYSVDTFCGSVHPRDDKSNANRDPHSQLLNIVILKFTSPVLLNQLGNTFQY